MPFSRKFLLNLRQEKKPRLNNATLLLARFLSTRASSGYCYNIRTYALSPAEALDRRGKNGRNTPPSFYPSNLLIFQPYQRETDFVSVLST